MTNREKLAYLAKDLEARGFSKANALPPLFRLLWMLRCEVPPPYFLSFGQAWLASGVAFGTLFGGFFGLVIWFFDLARSVPSSLIVFLVVGAGAAFGLSMAYWWSWQKEKLGLPPWRAYPPGS